MFQREVKSYTSGLSHKFEGNPVDWFTIDEVTSGVGEFHIWIAQSQNEWW